MYHEKRNAAHALSEPHRKLALHDAELRWSEFWAERPGCGRNTRCSARTPCRQSGCDCSPPEVLASQRSLSQAAESVSNQTPPLPDPTSLGNGALPDAGPSISAQTPDTIGTTVPSKVDPPDTTTNPALKVTIVPTAAPPPPTGLRGMFAKSKINVSTTTVLLCLLMLNFTGILLLGLYIFGF